MTPREELVKAVEDAWAAVLTARIAYEANRSAALAAAVAAAWSVLAAALAVLETYNKENA